MNIVKASPEFAAFMAARLSSHFLSLNSQFGYNKYKTDEEKILSHINERLTDEGSEFNYSVLLTDSGLPMGFVNTVCTPMVYEIIALNLTPEYDTPENTTALLQHAVDELKGKGADKILTEVSPLEVNYAMALQSLNATLVEQKFLIN